MKRRSVFPLYLLKFLQISHLFGQKGHTIPISRRIVAFLQPDITHLPAHDRRPLSFLPILYHCIIRMSSIIIFHRPISCIPCLGSFLYSDCRWSICLELCIETYILHVSSILLSPILLSNQKRMRHILRFPLHSRGSRLRNNSNPHFMLFSVYLRRIKLFI